MRIAIVFLVSVVACGGAAPEVSVETLLPQASQSICSALLRCCDTSSEERFFAVYNENEAFEDLRPLFPPQATLTEESCPGVVEQLLTRRPFGSWLAAEARGEVTFNADAAVACLSAIDEATCGGDLADELFNSRCFAFQAPEGGEEQRSIFSRTATEGASCSSLDDGFGGVLYGTCDPTSSFCCDDDGAGGCSIVSSGESGVCRATSAEGEACNIFPLQLCATGFECDINNTCVAPLTQRLAVGELCISDDFSLLGECVDSFCDILGTSRCETLRADGEACFAPDACRGGACTGGVCGQDSFCAGL